MINIEDILKQIQPFLILPADVLTEVADLITIKDYKPESVIYKQGKTKLKNIDIIIKGGYSARFLDKKGEIRLEEKYTYGEIFGGSAVLMGRPIINRTVVTQEKTTVLSLNRKEFRALCRSYEKFFHFFTSHFGQKILNDDYADFIRQNDRWDKNFLDADKIYTRRIKSIKEITIKSCSPETPAYKIAEILGRKTACVYVMTDDIPCGIVTQKILSNTIVRNRLDTSSPVSEIMDTTITHISKDALVYEALLKMFKQKSEYILVKDEEKFIGYLTRYQMLTEHAQSPLVFIQSVRLATSSEELKHKWDHVPEIVNQLLNRGVNAEIVNQIITTISDAILHRIIENTLNDFDKPPSEFAFIVLGSEGRQEQTLVTDQDNAIIYEDKANEQREFVRDYFLRFADKVSETLDYVGFSFCKGGFMAKNPKWTHSLSHWTRNYDSWIKESQIEDSVNIATFFDCRFVYGNSQLLVDLQENLNNSLPDTTSRFFYNLTNQALRYEPPLTFLRGIKTFTKDDKKLFDLKTAMTPIVDISRMYSLKYRVNEVNTGKRIKALFEVGCFTKKEYKELSQAYYYLMGLRLKKQARAITYDLLEPNNLIEPLTLTKVEQSTLIEIFKVISDFQLKIKIEFKNALL